MTPERSLRRAEFIREEPAIWFVYLLGASFLGLSLAWDLLGLIAPEPPRPLRYGLALSTAAVAWWGSRTWARRIVAARRAA